MAERIFDCPTCRGPFRVPDGQTTKRMRCPHCQSVVNLKELARSTAVSAPVSTRDSTSESEIFEQLATPATEPADHPIDPTADQGVEMLEPEIAGLLPPKFIVPSLRAAKCSRRKLESGLVAQLRRRVSAGRHFAQNGGIRGQASFDRGHSKPFQTPSPNDPVDCFDHGLRCTVVDRVCFSDAVIKQA